MTEPKDRTPFTNIANLTIEMLTEGTTEEEREKKLENDEWPFGISEEDMREDLNESKSNS